MLWRKSRETEGPGIWTVLNRVMKAGMCEEEGPKEEGDSKYKGPEVDKSGHTA